MKCIHRKGHEATFVVLVVNVISHVILVFPITIVVMDKNIYDRNNDGQWLLIQGIENWFNYTWKILQNIFKNQITCSIFLIMLHHSNFHHLSRLGLHVLLKANVTLQWIAYLFILKNLIFLSIMLWANHMPLCLVRCLRRIGAHLIGSPNSQLGGKVNKMNYTWYSTLLNGIYVDFHNVQMNLPIGHVDFARWFSK